jgi:hypothetical protein
VLPIFQRQVRLCSRRHLANPAGVSTHPNVRKSWELPGDNVLFEFYDPVYERIYSWNREIRAAAMQTASDLTQARACDAIYRSLLGPLFEGHGQLFHGISHAMPPLYSGFFAFLGYKRVSWPETRMSSLVDLGTSLEVLARLREFEPNRCESYCSIVNEWEEWAYGLHILKSVEPVRRDPDGELRSSYELTEPCGDAAMVLFLLLSLSRMQTTVGSIGFCAPSDRQFSLPPETT